MPRTHTPHGGSKQYWPRKRANRIYPRVKAISSSVNGLSGFCGYKVGMTHVIIKDNRSNSISKGQELVFPVTVLECPPLGVFSLRVYKKGVFGEKCAGEVISGKLDANLKRTINLPKKYNTEEALKKAEGLISKASYIVLVVYTQPSKAGVGKKRPEIFEIKINKGDVKSSFDFAKDLLNKEIKVSDALKEGNFVDVHAVSKGKGFQGVIKRYGLHLKSHKSQKKRREVGNLGAWIPKRILWTVARAGKMGFHTRTEYNKLILKLGKGDEINPKGDFVHYGKVKSDYVLIKGSVAGAVKRLIRLNSALRKVKSVNLDVLYISKGSKQ